METHEQIESARSQLAQLAQSYGVAYLGEVSSESFDATLIAAIPVTWAREQCVLPVRLAGVASLLISGPEGLKALQNAALATGVDLKPVFAERAEILRAVDAAYYAGKNTATRNAAPSGSATVAGGMASVVSSSAASTSDLGSAGAASAFGVPPTASVAWPTALAGEGADLLVDTTEPATQFLNNALLEAVRRGASDVHLEPETEVSPARLRFRLSGRLYEQPSPPRGLGERLVSRLKVMAGMDIAEHRLPQDGMAQVRIGGGRIVDVRVSTVPVSGGERAVLRLLNRDDSLLPLTSLGMPQPVLGPFSNMLTLPNGIVVVSGPTGSGKTTTLYSALGALNATRQNIMTIEDPVEYRLPQIAQIQVKPKIGLTFANGLRHILRQDPDVVLVGETRDAETAEIAVRASLTGHLVFTTLHTNDAPSAVLRLLDMGIEPYLLSSCLRGVLAQRLVRKVCPHCVQTLPFDAPGVTQAEAATARAAGCESVLKAVGCEHCLEGYTGRLGVFELLVCGGEVADAVHAGRNSSAELREVAQAAGGFHAMREDAAAKLRAGITTPAEVLAALGGV